MYKDFIDLFSAAQKNQKSPVTVWLHELVLWIRCSNNSICVIFISEMGERRLCYLFLRNSGKSLTSNIFPDERRSGKLPFEQPDRNDS